MHLITVYGTHMHAHTQVFILNISVKVSYIHLQSLFRLCSPCHHSLLSEGFSKSYAPLCNANGDEVYSGDSCVAAKLRIDLHARS